MNGQIRQLLVLALFIFLCFGAAGVGSRFTSSTVGTWYVALQKPAWNPPNWIFAPVWTFLYTAMAVAAWLVWRKKGLEGAALPLTFFFVQLMLNSFWSILFFGLRSPGLAMLDIVVLWAAILVTMILFWRVVPLAGVLFSPYFLWVSFAATLNYAIWRLN